MSDTRHLTVTGDHIGLDGGEPGETARLDALTTWLHTRDEQDREEVITRLRRDADQRHDILGPAFVHLSPVEDKALAMVARVLGHEDRLRAVLG
jgi:hypothetical protein